MFRIEKKIVVAHSLRNKIISVVMALIVAAVFIISSVQCATENG